MKSFATYALKGLHDDRPGNSSLSFRRVHGAFVRVNLIQRKIRYITCALHVC